MLQIKTVIDNSASKFDEEVNKALADGWTLTRRLAGPDAFVAELEKNIITEAEKCCENCKYCNVPGNIPPCADCNPDGGKCYWEAME